MATSDSGHKGGKGRRGGDEKKAGDKKKGGGKKKEDKPKEKIKSEPVEVEHRRVHSRHHHRRHHSLPRPHHRHRHVYVISEYESSTSYDGSEPEPKPQEEGSESLEALARYIWAHQREIRRKLIHLGRQTFIYPGGEKARDKAAQELYENLGFAKFTRPVRDEDYNAAVHECMQWFFFVARTFSFRTEWSQQLKKQSKKWTPITKAIPPLERYYTCRG